MDNDTVAAEIRTVYMWMVRQSTAKIKDGRYEP
jgi:hypothetical protein